MNRIPATGDLAFKKVFASEEHKDCLSGLIGDFFGVLVPTEEITIVNPYSIAAYREVVKGEEVSVLRHTLKDVAASLKFADFISEVQVRSTRFFSERALYYPFDRFCKNYNNQGYMELGPEGKPNRYSSLIPIYALNILGDPHFPDDDDALRIFELYDPTRNKRYKKELIKLGFFELSKSNIETVNQRHWRDYFLTGESHPDAPEYIKKASHIIEYENLSEEERNLSAILEKARADYDAGFSSAYNDGIEIGEQRGITIGEQRGITIGEQRGITIGEQRGITIGEQRGITIGEQRGIAKQKAASKKNETNAIINLLQAGTDVAIISSVYGKTVEEIKLMKEKKKD